MILTDRFVFIHLPKTGGTSVTAALRAIHEGRRGRAFLGRTLAHVRAPVLPEVNKHGFCSEIPESHRGLPIVACIRNPYSLLVSRYEYAWWKANPEQLTWVDWKSIRARHPRAPELTFPEFVEVSADHFPFLKGSPLPPPDRPGFLSVQFLRYFYLDPQAALAGMDEAALASARLGEGMHPVEFLHMENLNAELHALLSRHGYEPRETAFILDAKPVIPGGPGRRPEKPWREYYTPDLLRFVRHRERLLFRLFPEYDEPVTGGEPGKA